MSGFGLNGRLMRPQGKTDYGGLLDIWRQDVIELQLVGMGSFFSAATLLNKVRGALGNVLVQSGSLAVRRRRPCDWSPCCAAEVLFGKKPQTQIGPYHSEITKPYVLRANTRGQDLVIELHVFGFATAWTCELVPALVQALTGRVEWNKLAGRSKRFIPRELEILSPKILSPKILSPKILSPKTGAAGKIDLPDFTDTARLEFITPLDAERGTLEEKPHLVFDRLFRRVAMLGRWHEVDIAHDWQELERLWLACDYHVEPLGGQERGQENIRFGGHRFKNRIAAHQSIHIKGDLAVLGALLVLGERVHVGRGASIGLGQYALAPGDPENGG